MLWQMKENAHCKKGKTRRNRSKAERLTTLLFFFPEPKYVTGPEATPEQPNQLHAESLPNNQMLLF